MLTSSIGQRLAPAANILAGEVQQRLALELVRVVESAAVAAARTMGQGDPEGSDHAAVEAMRSSFETLPVNGIIVIGEGERDRAPMLYIGERVGAKEREAARYPEIDIAVDPLEGTNLCATGASSAIAVLAASERGGLLCAPDCYMDKIVAGPACRGALDIDAPVKDNLKAIAKRLDRDLEDLVITVLNRPRHERLISEIRETGARVRLIGDGDLSAGIATAVRGAGIHAVFGIGGAPEGVITAAAIRCLHGEMVGRLIIDTPELRKRVGQMGICDHRRVYTAEDLAPGKQIIVAASGVTTGALLTGVRFFAAGYRTHSLVMTRCPNEVRFMDSVHITREPGPKGIRLY